MPFVRIQLVEGRSPEAKAQMAQEIIETVHQHAGAPRENIHVIFENMRKEDYYHKKD
ncbi:2-hydroxymuconate tautomerase [Hutsoniella sourekii]